MAKKGFNIYHRKDGRWEGRFYLSGSRKYRSVYGSSYAETKERLSDLKELVIKPAKPCKLRFCDVVDMWLEYRRDSVKTTSFMCYQTKLRRHILPFFGERFYSSLTCEDLENFKAKKLEEGLSARYVSDIMILIKSVTRYAILVHSYADPFSTVKPPRFVKSEAKLLSGEQQKRFIEECKTGGLAGIGCFMSMFLGLRIGELCALKWESIDLRAGFLRVKNTIVRLCPGGKKKSAVMLLPPKSKTSARDIPLPEFVRRILLEWQSPDDCFLLSGTEKPVEPRTMTNRFKALLKKADVPSVKFHSLRHVFATNFLRKTGDIKSLSEILGHSSVDITLRVYIHSSMAQKMRCMEQMSEFL